MQINGVAVVRCAAQSTKVFYFDQSLNLGLLRSFGHEIDTTHGISSCPAMVLDPVVKIDKLNLLRNECNALVHRETERHGKFRCHG